MICKPCAEAADAVTRLGEPGSYVHTSVGVALYEAAWRGHMRCTGRTWCDCAHKRVSPGVECKE